MDTQKQQNPMPGEVLSIAEAARKLGVSQRTIYRRLRRGDLERVKTGDNDIMTASVTVEARQISQVKPVSQPSKILTNILGSIDIPNDIGATDDSAAVERLSADLRHKDEQIDQLLAAQRELIAANQRQQEQMFELARLVLLQNNAPAAPPLADVPRQETDVRRFLDKFFRSRDKH